jgi:glucokinase
VSERRSDTTPLCCIALDVGGTSVKSGVVGPGGVIEGKIVVTPIDSAADARNILDTLANIIRRHLEQVERCMLRGVAFGIPGPFDYTNAISYIHGVAKYESLYGLNLLAALRERLQMDDLPIVFGNDGEAAVVGEARYGAGRPYRRLIGVTLGTGIGSAFVIGGVPTADGPGIPRNGWLYNALFGGVQADDIFSIRGLLARAEAAGTELSDIPAAADAARHGDPTLRCVFRDFGADLGRFLAPFVRAFAADAVLALGGLADTFDLFGPALIEQLPVPAVTGQLGPCAALLGAAALLGEGMAGGQKDVIAP